MRRPAICAHRGASRAHPENSLAAFATAIEMGADMIETDVRRTPRGKLVLHHDPLGPRRPRGLVELAELVALADGRVALDIELKEAGYEEEVLAALDPRPEGLVVTSFIPKAVAAVHALDPGIATGLIFRPGDRRELAARAEACGARMVVAHSSALRPELGAELAAAGRPLMVWTVNDRRRLAAVMTTPGVTHLVTDVPDVALALRAAL
ncbi:MAG TPA: glycerophosphodiester phosphodiesterase [Gaiellales bacterium]|nr:glycerophosphodiester phosphodiesterase [Gaiellales bacterium]